MNLKKIDLDISDCDRKTLLDFKDYVSAFSWTELKENPDGKTASFMASENFNPETLKLPSGIRLCPWVLRTQTP